HEGGDLGIFIGLPLHHMAPVTGRITDRNQDRFVFTTGFFKGLGSPGIPVDWVTRVLQKVGTFLVNQPIFCHKSAGIKSPMRCRRILTMAPPATSSMTTPSPPET